MNKIKEYIDLTKDLREKRNAMRASRAKITSYHISSSPVSGI